ncbi:MAG: NUDIX domain-containing protein [Burkholderiales bacterium]
MWLFTNFGFFSVVQKNGEPELTVRSRTQGDLLRLQRHYLPGLSEPVFGQGTDYPWRARCQAGELAKAMARIVGDIEYANFKDEVGACLGPERAHRCGKVWSAMHGIDDDLPEPAPAGWEALPWPEKVPAGKARAFGGVVVDPTGRILLREVAGHYDGYVWSFAKGRPAPGESPRATALREVADELGVRARILLPLPGTYTGSTTHNHFFLMTVDPAAVDLSFRCRETSGLRWVLPEEARALISRTTNEAGRARDLALLEATLASLPSPFPLQRPIARREDWKTRPLPAARSSLAFTRTLTPQEMVHVVRGFIPAVMEEKWFVYFEDHVIRFHRSWTGIEIFRVHLRPADGKPGTWQVARVEVNRHPDQYQADNDADVHATLQDLIEGLLRLREEPTIDPMVAAMQLATQPSYLGSPDVVRELVSRYFDVVSKHLARKASFADVTAASCEFTSAMTDDPAYTRMPWHSREQLGESLIALMNLDKGYCADEDLALVVSESTAAVSNAMRELLKRCNDDTQAHPKSDVLPRLQAMADFVVAAFLGTAALLYPGKTLADFHGVPAG